MGMAHHRWVSPDLAGRLQPVAGLAHFQRSLAVDRELHPFPARLESTIPPYHSRVTASSWTGADKLRKELRTR